MIRLEVAIAHVKAFAALPFFPSEETAIAAIAADVQSYCQSEEQLKRHRNLVFQFWNKWEGPAELRAAFCALFRPMDGREVRSILYPAEGYPPLRPGLEKLGMSIGAIDGLKPHPKQIAQWEQECGPPFPELSRNLLGAAVASQEQKLLPAPAGFEFVTREHLEESVFERERRRDQAIQSLRRAGRLASQLPGSLHPNSREVELDRQAVQEIYGTQGISRDQARDLLDTLADLPGFSAEVADGLALELYRRAPDYEHALAAVGAMRRNWRYLLEASK